MENIQRKLETFKVRTPLTFDTPLEPYTTFRVGGPAEVLAEPDTVDDLIELMKVSHDAGIPVTVLGGGSNILISDRGISGMVIRTTRLTAMRRDEDRIHVGAGAPIGDASAFAANHGLGGLDFIYGMPGTTGGAVWMNARCYDGEISNILDSVRLLPLTSVSFHDIEEYHTKLSDFAYKVSPFQDNRRVIFEATFKLSSADPDKLWQHMREHEDDRRQKGHYTLPCAGSIFKNNHTFGAPSGKIIDSVGMRGIRHGGAQVSENHGNIIVNTGSATAEEIRELIEHVQSRVFDATGFMLEPEVLYLGDW